MCTWQHTTVLWMNFSAQCFLHVFTSLADTDEIYGLHRCKYKTLTQLTHWPTTLAQHETSIGSPLMSRVCWDVSGDWPLTWTHWPVNWPANPAARGSTHMQLTTALQDLPFCTYGQFKWIFLVFLLILSLLPNRSRPWMFVLLLLCSALTCNVFTHHGGGGLIQHCFNGFA